MKNQKGISLVEILVALTLASVILTIIIGSSGSGDRSELEKAVSNFANLVKSCENEAVLRNRTSRIVIDMPPEGGQPQFKVEYLSQETFVLPDMSIYDGDNLSTSEREKREAVLKDIDSNFKESPEFPEELRTIENESITFVGASTSLRDSFVNDSQIAIYCYASGEKDSTIAIVANYFEAIVIRLEPFTGKIETDYVIINSDEEYEDELQKIAEQAYEQWLKN